VSKYNYGWQKPVGPIVGPKYCQIAPQSGIVLPASVDLTPEFPACYDQGQLGSCTANATAGLFQWLQSKEKRASFTPSRLFIYYNERVIDGSPVSQDTGSQVGTGIKVLASLGGPNEELWPYVESKFADKPGASVYTAATEHKIHSYHNIDSTNRIEIMTCLAEGYPVAIGFTVYEQMESQAMATNPYLQLPAKGEQSIGGHAVVIVGYLTVAGVLYFIIRNSWGTDWGKNGYFFMPASYATDPDLASDFWTVRPAG
jgi:C1A family cysteine protease